MRLNFELPASLSGERVDRVVALLCSVTRAEAGELVDAGSVMLDGKRPSRRAVKVAAGQVLEVDAPEPREPSSPQPDASVAIPVVYADDDVAVVDKPAGLVVHPGAGNPDGTLVNGLLHAFPDMARVGEADRPGIVHRLDVGTSGLMMVALSELAYDSLVSQLQDRRVSRRYRAVVCGHVADDRGLIDAPIGRSRRQPTKMAVEAAGREARTHYEVTARFDDPVEASDLTCQLDTGRTHQIRVHMAAIGHPVVGDDRYGGQRPGLEFGRPALHAAELTFSHPVSGEQLSFRSDQPADLAGLLAGLS